MADPDPSDPLLRERDLANKCFHSEDWSSAAAHYTAIINVVPNDVDAHYYRGYCYAQLQRWTEAYSDASEALRLQPEFLYAEEAYSLCGAYHQSTQRFDLAIEDYSKAIVRRQDPGYFFERGKCLALLAKYQQAIADINIAVNQEYLLTESLFLRGQCHRCLKNWQEAQKDFDQFISLDPTRVWAFAFRGECHMGQREWSLAIADFSEVIRLHQDSDNEEVLAQAYEHRAHILFITERLEEAIPDFNEAIRRRPQNSDLYHWRGHCFHQLQRWSEAKADFDQALNFTPSSASNYFVRAEYYRIQKDQDAAIADYNQAIELDPQLRMPYFGRAQAFMVKGEWAAALDDLNEILEQSADTPGIPGWAEVYQLRAECYEALGLDDPAQEDRQTAADLRRKPAGS